MTSSRIMCDIITFKLSPLGLEITPNFRASPYTYLRGFRTWLALAPIVSVSSSSPGRHIVTACLTKYTITQRYNWQWYKWPCYYRHNGTTGLVTIDTTVQVALLLSRPSKIRSNAVIVVQWLSGSVCQLSNGQFLYLHIDYLCSLAVQLYRNMRRINQRPKH